MQLKLKELRKNANKTQLELSKIFNIAKSTLCQYENGDREPPLNFLFQFANYICLNR